MGIIYKNGIPYGNQPNGTVPSGGTTGQVLKKKSNTDYDTEWANESGGGGTSDYTQLSNKPQINGVTLTGNKSLSDIGAASQSDLEDLEDITGDGQLSGFTATDLTGAANELKNTLNSKADKSDLTSLDLTGTTNTTGSKIDAGTYFYLNGALVRAKVDIANGATFTSGTNYEAVTAGGLNSLKSESGNGYCKMPDGTLIQWGNSANLAFNITTSISGTGMFRGSYQINFPISFSSATYVISGSSQYSTGLSFPFGAPYSGMVASYASVYIYNDTSKSGNEGRINWLAVGRWK